MDTTTNLPTLHNNPVISDQANSSPSAAQGTIVVMRAALAEATATAGADLVDATKQFDPALDSQLSWIFGDAERCRCVVDLLDSAHGFALVGDVTLYPDLEANVIWGRDAGGAFLEAVRGIAAEHCKQTVDWAMQLTGKIWRLN